MRKFDGIVLGLALVGTVACKSGATADAVKAPSNLGVVALEGGAHLTWQDNSNNEAQFMIERMDSGSDWKVVGMVPFDTAQYHDPNLTPGTTYMYRVMAMPKSGDKGSYSNQVTFIAPAGTGAAVGAGTGGMGTAGAPAQAPHQGTGGA